MTTVADTNLVSFCASDQLLENVILGPFKIHGLFQRRTVWLRPGVQNKTDN